VTEANGTVERETALEMIEDNGGPRSMVGADELYDTADFVVGCRDRGCTPHCRSAIDGRTKRHPGYTISQHRRKCIEECFGWIKTIGGLCKTRHCGRAPWSSGLVLIAAVYNLVRLRKLLI